MVNPDRLSVNDLTTVPSKPVVVHLILPGERSQLTSFVFLFTRAFPGSLLE